MLSVEKQKKYLSKNLIVESLRKSDNNKEDIKQFSQSKGGSAIVEYLKGEAWDKDASNDTKVFLVRDRNTREIAYYYALNCGILYKDLDTTVMTSVEKECVERLIKALRRVEHVRGSSDTEEEFAYNELSNAYGAMDERIIDPDRATFLTLHAQEQAEIKDQREESVRKTEDSQFVKNVQETYPAIDIKFLCKNENYVPNIQLSFKLGVYVFWEIIVPHILRISEAVGCKYVYLFAADTSEGDQIDVENNVPIMYSKDYDMDEEPAKEATISKKQTPKKLVLYYMSSLKFRPVSDFIILKPYFERSCYTLFQDVASLTYNRDLIWNSHALPHEFTKQ